MIKIKLSGREENVSKEVGAVHTSYINEFLFRKLDIAKHPATDGLYLYVTYIDRAPPIEKPPTIILLDAMPLEISVSINFDTL